MKTIAIQVKPFYGANVQTVAEEICILANKLETPVETDVNGVLLIAKPGSDPIHIRDMYYQRYDQFRGNHTMRVAQ